MLSASAISSSVNGTYSAKFACTRMRRNSSRSSPSPISTRCMRRQPMTRMLNSRNSAASSDA